MHYKEVVDEVRQKVVLTAIDYDDPALNHAFAAKQKKRIVEIIEQTPDYVLARTGDGFNGRIIAFSPDYSRALYIVRYLSKRWPWLPRTVTQVELWRRSGAPAIKGITEHVFFGFLLPRYHTILSDLQQSDSGQRFWADRLGDAAQKGLHVGVAHMAQKTVSWFNPSSDGPLDVWLRAQNTFGASRKYQAIRYIISETAALGRNGEA